MQQTACTPRTALGSWAAGQVAVRGPGAQRAHNVSRGDEGGGMHMLTKLLMVLHSKVALVAIGLTLVAGTGTVAETAATGKALPLLAQVEATPTPGQHDPNEPDGPNHDGQPSQRGQTSN